MDFVLYILPFVLVRLRTFRSVHGLVRCKHERRCSRAHGADVSFRDVSIKIPDRNETRDVSDVTHRKCGLRFEKSQLVEFCRRKKKVGFRLLAEALWWVRMWFGADGEVSIERWYLSPYVEKPLTQR